jgi:Tfp pilus assembly protein PilO
MRQTKSSISILLAGILFIGALVVYGNFIKPLYFEIKNLQAEKQAKQQQRDEYQTISDHTQKLISSYQNYADLQKTISLSFPSNPEIPQIINQINGLAIQSGLTLKSFDSRELALNPSASFLIGAKGTIRTNIRLSGRYEAFRSFLNKLENNIRIFQVNTISIEKASNIPNDFGYNLEVDAFYQAQPQTQ